MSSILKGIVVCVLGWALSPSMGAQTSIEQILQPPATSANKASNEKVDPYNRTTPAGTIYGFLQAAQSGNYSIAAQYLQLSAARRQSEGEQLAMKLKVVMDMALPGSLKGISDQPEGTPQEDVPLDHQKVG